MMLMCLCDAYRIEQLEEDSRTVLSFTSGHRPIKACVLPSGEKNLITKL